MRFVSGGMSAIVKVDDAGEKAAAKWPDITLYAWVGGLVLK